LENVGVECVLKSNVEENQEKFGFWHSSRFCQIVGGNERNWGLLLVWNLKYFLGYFWSLLFMERDWENGWN